MSEVIQSAEPWFPILVVALFYALLRLTAVPDLQAQYDTTEFRELYIQQSGATRTEADRNIGLMRRYTAPLVFVESPVLVAGGVILTALVLYAFGRLLFHTPVRYKSVMTMVAWGGVIGVIPLAANLILYYINPTRVFPTSAAYLLPGGMQNSYFYGVLSAVDVFFVWQASVITIGVSKLFGVSMNRAVTFVGTVMVCFAALFGVSIAMAQ